MKKETVQNKLAELLGLEQFKIKPKSKGSSVKNEGPVGVSEDAIQNFRAAQGLSYFLQAPELFTAKKCPHCGEDFLVSRQFVAFCSYTCIERDLAEKGIKWSRSGNLDTIGRDIYEGNEPIWIRNLERLRTVLDSVAIPLLGPQQSQSTGEVISTSEPSSLELASN